MPWENIIIAGLPTAGVIASAWFSAKSAQAVNATDKRFEDIQSDLISIKSQVSAIDTTTSENKEISKENRDGVTKIQRYRLFNDLKKEIQKGYTTIEVYRELGILFDSYSKLGGNGEIKVLFKKYQELPIKEE